MSENSVPPPPPPDTLPAETPPPPPLAAATATATPPPPPQPEPALPPKEPGETDRIDALNAEALLAGRDNGMKAIALACEALAAAEKIHYTHGIAQALHRQAQITCWQGQRRQSVELFARALSSYRAIPFPAGEIAVLTDLGALHREVENPSGALAHLLKARQILQNQDDKTPESELLHQIGALHRTLGQLRESKSAYESALWQCRERGDRPGECLALYHLGLVLLESGQAERARDSLLGALEAAAETSNRPRLALCLMSLGEVMASLDDRPQAGACFNQAIASFKESGHKTHHAEALLGLAKFLLSGAENEHPEAEKALLEARDLATAIPSPALASRSCRLLSELHERAGRPDEALRHFREHHAQEKQIALDQADLLRQRVEIITQEEVARRESELQRQRAAELSALQSELAYQRVIAQESAGVCAHLLRAVAHDLRNQVSGLAGLCNLATEEADSEPPDHAAIRGYNAEAQKSAASVLETLNRLLDHAAEPPINLHSERLGLASLATAAVRASEENAARKGQTLRLKTEPGCVALADPVRLRQALEYLLANAIAYSPENRAISVTVRKTSSRALIEVADEGAGLSETDKRALFHPYSPLGQSAIGETSLGLSLSLAREIMRLHHGEIRAESPGPGMGATFTLDLPLLR